MTHDTDALTAPLDVNTSTNSEPAPLIFETNGGRKLAAVIALVALADWLFFGRFAGISAAVFLAALSTAVVLTNPMRASRGEMLIAVCVLLLGAAPIVIYPGLTAYAFGILGAGYFSLTAIRGRSSAADKFADIVGLLVEGVWRAMSDVFNAAGNWPKHESAALRIRALAIWIVPLVVGLVFFLLLRAANPLIESWFSSLDIRFTTSNLSIARVLFWIVLASLVWPFVFMLGQNQAREIVDAEIRGGLSISSLKQPQLLLGRAAVLRSLVLFNLMFAVQTVLDIVYLWSGVELPQGMTYADYAHRGAYPLIATALLAACFVVVSTRPGSEAERSPPIRYLVFLWVGQNILLVISAMLRLDLYVATYFLTYWRVAAFIWMLLVTMGLALIIARIALAHSNWWLVKANLAAIAMTAYVCCFVNFPRIIGDYNVTHSQEFTGKGVWLDHDYLISLGPQALPSINLYLRKQLGEIQSDTANGIVSPRFVGNLLYAKRVSLPRELEGRLSDWRAWNYYDWKLLREISAIPAETSCPTAQCAVGKN